MESSPCTPTPFKSALALQEAKYGPLKLLVRRKLISSHLNLLCASNSVHMTHQRICLLQNVTLAQQMAETIKQEPIECAIDQPPLKKIKQEVLST